jgi:hypothetical protein
MIVHSQQMEARAALFAEGAALQAPLPPTERDFLVFERVVIESATTRAAAEEFGLSQTRVMQIRERVAEWIGSQVPETPRLSPRQRLGLASHIAEGQIDHLYAQAMEGWRKSQGTQTTVRSSDHGETTITKESHGDIKYLALASRIAERKFGVVVKGIEAEGKIREGEVCREGEAPAGPRRRQASGVRQHPDDVTPTSVVNHREADASRSPTSDPLVWDCSRFSAALPAAGMAPIAPRDATADESEVYSEIERRRRAFLAALDNDTSPVQPPRVDAGGMLREEETGDKKAGDEETEERDFALAAVLPLAPGEREVGRRDAYPTVENGRQDTSPTTRPLSRRERRARQRMLEKKLKLRQAK